MKHRKSLLKTTILLLGGGLLALTSLTSCENFMKSGQVRDEIVDAIAYNNAPSCTVNFTDEGMGEFLGNKKETFKVGYAAQIQFEVNQDDYHFTGFEAVTNDSEKTPLSDSVKFENADDDNRNASKGIYKYNVTILKHNKNILIRPVCKLLPKITQIAPKFESSGCDQDTPIQITFNKAVNSETFDPASISIFADEDLAQYFNTPQLTSDKKTIYISQKELILKPNDTKNFLNIEVDYDFTSLKDSDGLTLTTQGTHSYKINKSFGDQKFVKVQPQTDDAYGKFLSTEEKDCTVGYTIDIQFTLKKQDYKFVKFVPVISNGTTETSADCVIFENEEYDDQTGIYKASVKVTKALNDKEKIIIRPECMIIPKVISYTPVSNKTYPNIPIEINFNVPLTESVFNDIKLSYYDTDITDFFEDPYFNTDKTSITFNPKQEFFTFVIEKNTPVVDISVSFSNDTSISIGNNNVTPAFEKFAVHYTTEKDTTAPRQYDFIVTRHEVSVETAASIEDEERFTLEDFWVSATKDGEFDLDNYDKEQILQNRTSGIIYIYGHYLDEGSGVKTIIVTEQRTHDEDSYDVIEDPSEPVLYTKNSPGIEFINDGRGSTFFCIKHNLSSEDGAIKVNVKVCDYFDLPSEQNFIAIKISKMYFPELYAYNLPKDFNGKFSQTFSEYTENAKNLKIYREMELDRYSYYNEQYPLDLAEYIYGSAFISSGDFKLFCEYINSSGELVTQSFSAYDSNTNYWNLDLDVESLSELAIKIIVEDEDLGISGEKDFVFPPELIVNQMIKYSSYKKVTFASISGAYFSDYCLMQYSSNGTFASYRGKFSSTEQTLYNDSQYKIVSHSESLYGDIIDLNIPDDPVPQVNVTGVSFSKSQLSRNTDMTVTVAEDSWEKYDMIYFDLSSLSPGANHSIGKQYFSKGSLTKTVTEPTTYFYDSTINFTIYGIKGQVGSKKVYTYDGPTGVAYDNIAPNLFWYQSSFDEYTFYMEDEIGEQPDSGTVTIGDKNFEMDEEHNYKVTIPIYILKENENEKEWYDAYPRLYYNYILRDKSNNQRNQSSSIMLDQFVFPNFISVENSDTTWTFSTDRLETKPTIITKPIDPINDYIIIYSLGTDGKWTEIVNQSYELQVAGNKQEGFVCSFSGNLTLPENSILKVIGKHCRSNSNNDENNIQELLKKYEYSDPFYFYTGAKSSGTFDFIIPNGNSKSSVVISSDKPVFVHTAATKVSYEECKDWTAQQWEHFNRQLGDTYLDFETYQRPQIYSVPLDEIKDYKCYVIIVHFADGTTAMSEVMQR